MNIWFTADTHFGHEGILIHQAARSLAFKTIVDMDTALMDEIHSVVCPGDILWHLGDFCWQASRAGHYRMRMPKKVQLHMCVGNHDSNSLASHCSTFQQMAFPKYEHGHEVVRLHLCHYPLWSWSSRPYGGIHLYGHCHGMAEDRLNYHSPGRMALDVGVDSARRILGKWRPFSLAEVVDFLNLRRQECSQNGNLDSDVDSFPWEEESTSS